MTSVSQSVLNGPTAFESPGELIKYADSMANSSLWCMAQIFVCLTNLWDDIA